MRWLVCCVIAFGCHHDAAPAIVDPGTPPLPPASGTPIGYLIDDADLKLTDDQVAKLRDLDTSLGAELDKLDAQSRAANRPPDDGSSTPPPSMGRRGGGRHGGMGGGGGGSRPHRNRGGGAGSGSANPSGGAATANRFADERSADVREALHRAFAILDPTQQAIARRLLADHDVDVDVAPVAPDAAGSDEADPAPEP